PRCRAEQENVARNEAPVMIAVAMAQEPDRLVSVRIGCVDPVQVGHVETVAIAVDVGPGRTPAVEHMQALRRRVDEIDMPAVEPIGRENLAEQDDHVKGEEQRPRYDGNPMPPE